MPNESGGADRLSEARRPANALLRWLLMPAVVVIVTVGVWFTGGVITDDELLAKGLTVLWFLAIGIGVLLLAWRRRSAALPAFAGYVIAAGGLGGYLLYTSTVDRVVDEDVVVAEEEPSDDPGDGASTGQDPATGDTQTDEANALVSRGAFVAGEHPTSGIASVVDTAEGVYVTLTRFQTDPGPDLRVYFVRAGAETSDGEDLGALKGNKGDQQYEVPASLSHPDLQLGTVVIWCRAFSVAFGSARLGPN